MQFVRIETWLIRESLKEEFFESSIYRRNILLISGYFGPRFNHKPCVKQLPLLLNLNKDYCLIHLRGSPCSYIFVESVYTSTLRPNFSPSVCRLPLHWTYLSLEVYHHRLSMCSNNIHSALRQNKTKIINP